MEKGHGSVDRSKFGADKMDELGARDYPRLFTLLGPSTRIPYGRDDAIEPRNDAFQEEL
jgi:hypothetical protein